MIFKIRKYNPWLNTTMTITTETENYSIGKSSVYFDKPNENIVNFCKAFLEPGCEFDSYVGKIIIHESNTISIIKE